VQGKDYVQPLRQEDPSLSFNSVKDQQNGRRGQKDIEKCSWLKCWWRCSQRATQMGSSWARGFVRLSKSKTLKEFPPSGFLPSTTCYHTVVKVALNATSHVWFHESLIPGPSCGQGTGNRMLWASDESDSLGGYCALVRGFVCSSPKTLKTGILSTLVGGCDGPRTAVSGSTRFERPVLDKTLFKRNGTTKAFIP